MTSPSSFSIPLSRRNKESRQECPLPNTRRTDPSERICRTGLLEKARRTLTLDNGNENAQHEAITDAIGMQCYFARPYASWQRGTNESVNGLVRRCFPKGTDFGKITDEQVAKVESIINNRPRKCLGYKTPLEVASAFVALRP